MKVRELRLSSLAFLAVIGLTSAGCVQTAPPPTAQPAAASPTVIPAEQASSDLANARAAFVSAYNAADTDRFVALFAPNGTYSGLRQTTWVQGTDQLHSMWAIAFNKDKARNFVFQDPLTTLSDDNKVAVDVGYARMMMAPKAGTPVSRMRDQPMRISITWIRSDQGWKILSMSASPKTAIAQGFLPGH